MFKTWLANDITIYNDKSNKVVILTAVIKIYLNLWCNHRRTVNILKTDYLQMSFKKNWKQKMMKLLKQIYSLNKEACQLINNKFDELHVQKQIKWST